MVGCNSTDKNMRGRRHGFDLEFRYGHFIFHLKPPMNRMAHLTRYLFGYY